MNNFLLELIKFWDKKWFFREEVVWGFSSNDENFEKCIFKWINWDRLNDSCYSRYYSSKPKSCDVIKFLEEQIDFIEFKTLYIWDTRNINTKINEFQLTKKLEWSYDLIKKIINENDFVYENKNDLIKEIYKQFYVSIYLHWIDPQNRFILAEKIKKIKRNLEWYFKNHPMPFGENFWAPKFIRTEDINNIYKS